MWNCLLTLRRLSGEREPIHFQRSFQSERLRRLALRAAPDCECQHELIKGT
jgi:hypothetical protein